MLGADFAEAAVETDAGNGKVLAYLAAHAEIYRQEFHGDRVRIRCYLPRHLLHHIQGPDVRVRFLGGQRRNGAVAQASGGVYPRRWGRKPPGLSHWYRRKGGAASAPS